MNRVEEKEQCRVELNWSTSYRPIRPSIVTILPTCTCEGKTSRECVSNVQAPRLTWCHSRDWIKPVSLPRNLDPQWHLQGSECAMARTLRNCAVAAEVVALSVERNGGTSQDKKSASFCGEGRAFA